jgi:precorrin-3B methylase
VIVSAILRVERGVSLAEQTQVIVPITAGAIIDAVSALFFVQSNRARQLMTEFFDKLREDRKFDESLRLVNEVSDNALRSRLQTLLALNFAQVSSGDSMLRIVLNGISEQSATESLRPFGSPPAGSASSGDKSAQP